MFNPNASGGTRSDFVGDDEGGEAVGGKRGNAGGACSTEEQKKTHDPIPMLAKVPETGRNTKAVDAPVLLATEVLVQ